MVYNAIWCASLSYPYIYSYQVSMKSAKALPRYGSGHKSVYSKKHFFKIQRAITPLLTDGVQCHLACIIVLSIYILIPSFNEIRQSTSKIWLRTQKCRTDNTKSLFLRLWRGIINLLHYLIPHNKQGSKLSQNQVFNLKKSLIKGDNSKCALLLNVSSYPPCVKFNKIQFSQSVTLTLEIST